MKLNLINSIDKTDDLIAMSSIKEDMLKTGKLEKSKLSEQELSIVNSFYEGIVNKKNVVIDNVNENISVIFSSTSIKSIPVKETMDYNTLSGNTKKIVDDFVSLVNSKLN